MSKEQHDTESDTCAVCHEKYKEMTAGAEMDILVAERVYGWRQTEYETGRKEHSRVCPDTGFYRRPPFYSLEVYEAWRAMEAYSPIFWKYCTMRQGRRGYYAEVHVPESGGASRLVCFEASGPHAAVAICRALLMATEHTLNLDRRNSPRRGLTSILSDKEQAPGVPESSTEGFPEAGAGASPFTDKEPS